MKLPYVISGIILALLGAFALYYVLIVKKEELRNRAIGKLAAEIKELPSNEAIESTHKERIDEITKELAQADAEEIISEFEKTFPRRKP